MLYLIYLLIDIPYIVQINLDLLSFDQGTFEDSCDQPIQEDTPGLMGVLSRLSFVTRCLPYVLEDFQEKITAFQV